MSNMLAVQQQPANVDWTGELRGASMLLKSGLIPKDIKTAEAAMFCILAGRDLGLSAVQSLRSIRPIQGKLELSADVQLGLFNRSGGKFRWIKLDNTLAELELHAPWMTAPHISKFGVEEAKRADLMSNPMYRKYPVQMFRSRAITSGLKDIGFLATAGIYAPGEISGAASVDPASGEVLPVAAELVGSSSTESRESLKDGSGTTGSVESMADDDREELLNKAQSITEAVLTGDMETALNVWRSNDNDEKVAIWAMLDKEVRKGVKAADKAVKESAAIDPLEGDGASHLGDIVGSDPEVL